MEENKNTCPCCGRHCPLNDVQCERGRNFIETGEIPERTKQKEHRHHDGHQHDHHKEMSTNEHISRMLGKCGHILRHQAGGKASQSRVLQILSEHKDKMTQKDVMDRMDIQPGSLSELLGKMEHSDLIERMQNAQDKRNMDVLLTTKGKDLYEQSKAEQEKEMEALFSCLEDSEKQQLEQLLGKILKNWKQTHKEEHHRHKK